MRQRLQADAVVPALVAKVQRRLGGAIVSPSRMAGQQCMLWQQAIGEHYFHFQVKEGWRDKVHFCLRSALESTVVYWALRPLPPCLYVLYALLGDVYNSRACGPLYCPSLPLCHVPIMHCCLW